MRLTVEVEAVQLWWSQALDETHKLGKGHCDTRVGIEGIAKTMLELHRNSFQHAPEPKDVKEERGDSGRPRRAAECNVPPFFVEQLVDPGSDLIDLFLAFGRAVHRHRTESDNIGLQPAHMSRQLARGNESSGTIGRR